MNDKEPQQPASAGKSQTQQSVDAEKPQQPESATKRQQPPVAEKNAETKKRRRVGRRKEAQQPEAVDEAQQPEAEEAQQPAITAEKERKPKAAGSKSRKRIIPIGIVALVFVLAGAAVWWTLIRDDGSSGTAQVSVSGDQIPPEGAVRIVQVPSLAATATVDGLPADGPVDITFGSPSELVVSVLNNGNLTMDDITVTLEFIGDDAAATDSSDPCEVPPLAPQESGDCALEFTPTDAMTSVVAKILGYGPQEQEVELSVTVALS